MPPAFRLFATTALAPLIWGSTYLVTSEFLPPGRPLHAAMLRCLPAGLVLLLWVRQWPQKGEWGRLALLSLLNIGVFQALLFIAAYRLPGGVAAILTATQTLMVLALGWLITRQRQPAAAWGWALAGVAGIALLLNTTAARLDGLGIAAALASAAAAAGGVFFAKHWPTRLSLLAFTGWQLLLGGLFLLPLALFLEDPLPPLNARQLGGYLYLCLAGSGLAYVLFFRGIRHLPPASVTSLGLLSPVCAFVLGWLFLGQSLGPAALAGFALTLISIIGVQRAIAPTRR